jgi:hypothetical protein
MLLVIDHEEPEDSVNRFHTEVTYDGKPESDVLSVPAHWHKVQSMSYSSDETRTDNVAVS